MAIPTHKSILITDRLLRSSIRCRRKAWLDSYGDKSKKLWSAHRTLQLDHQHQSFISLLENSKSKSIGSCQEGAPFVLGLKLKLENSSGYSLQASPAIIQKIDGKSKWGDFSYRPVITRQGNNLTREHRLILSLTGQLLENHQEAPVNEAIVICKKEKRLDIEVIKLTESLGVQVLESINKLTKDLKLLVPPPLTQNRRKCAICSWRGICNLEASSQGHLTEVNGIGGKRLEMLKKVGITNLEELSKSNPNQIKDSLGDINGELSNKIIQQALVKIENKEKHINQLEALPELKDAPGVLLYDIESDPDKKHDFLHGFLKLKHDKNGSWGLDHIKYQPLLNINNDNENYIWERIRKKLNNYPDWPILHYGDTELLSITKLAHRQNINRSDIQIISNRFIDIQYILKKHWVLPLTSYSLKSVAKHIGFDWDMKGVDGSMALLWWRQWKNSRKLSKSFSKNLNYIFNYNKDDCLATWAITSWMLTQDNL
ncbi:TM0106 family RecB-like putative nuclease [Prochlorococcus sp. MIT 1223]|uniref:TM0106 family RecB-like putative nuclease n=1 Tax=Prochlorococcus sp. MIT 1223 TaxID=3096217 RepID=UPI002A74B758|nr:TM0106 family RecB-like putative nuclease [Prochlorococcus sp. MIT 1223]